MPSRPKYRCVHCGEPCGVTGHLARLDANLFGQTTAAGGWCPAVGAVRVTQGGEVWLGFRCPPGHTCLTSAVGLPAGGPAGEAQPFIWRFVDRRTDPPGWTLNELFGHEGGEP